MQRWFVEITTIDYLDNKHMTEAVILSDTASGALNLVDDMLQSVTNYRPITSIIIRKE